MSSVEEKKFLRLIKFSYNVSLDVTRTFTEKYILSRYNNSLHEFLTMEKHKLYHYWQNEKPCCECIGGFLARRYPRRLVDNEIKKLYDITGRGQQGHAVFDAQGRVQIHCLCRVSVQSPCSLEHYDVTLIYTLLRSFAILNSDDTRWINDIKEVRNFLAHANSTAAYDVRTLDKNWKTLEAAVLGLARKIKMTYYARTIETLITTIKKEEFDDHDIKSILHLARKESGRVISTLYEQTRILHEVLIKSHTDLENRLAARLENNHKDIQETVESLSKSILTANRSGTETSTVKIGNLSLHVKCSKLDEDLQGTASCEYVECCGKYQGNMDRRRTPDKDRNLCRTAWSISNPGCWDMNDLVDKVKENPDFTPEFQIQFAKIGSLSIDTTVPAYIMHNKDLLRPAVRTFLLKLIEVGGIDVQERSTVSVNIDVIADMTKGNLDDNSSLAGTDDFPLMGHRHYCGSVSSGYLSVGTIGTTGSNEQEIPTTPLKHMVNKGCQTVELKDNDKSTEPCFKDYKNGEDMVNLIGVNGSVCGQERYQADKKEYRASERLSNSQSCDKSFQSDDEDIFKLDNDSDDENKAGNDSDPSERLDIKLNKGLVMFRSKKDEHI